MIWVLCLTPAGWGGVVVALRGTFSPEKPEIDLLIDASHRSGTPSFLSGPSTVLAVCCLH